VGGVQDQRDRVVRQPDNRGHKRGLSGSGRVPGPIS
jgi:hypothetical protein